MGTVAREGNQFRPNEHGPSDNPIRQMVAAGDVRIIEDENIAVGNISPTKDFPEGFPGSPALEHIAFLEILVSGVAETAAEWTASIRF